MSDSIQTPADFNNDSEDIYFTVLESLDTGITITNIAESILEANSS